MNPFSLQLFMNASFKGWHKLAMQNASRRKEEAALGQAKQPTLASAELGIDQSYAQEDEDECVELVYETMEDVELDDSNSFVSEDFLDDDREEVDDYNEEVPSPKKKKNAL